MKLKDICSFQSGGTPSKSNAAYYNGTIPWITTVSLNGNAINENNAIEWITDQAIKESAAKIVPENSIMVGTRVGVGKTAINTVPMSTNQDIISLIGIDESIWDKRFINKLIQSKSVFLNSQARGATIKGIKIDVLANISVPDLPIAKQQEIVTILDNVQDVIAKRQYELQSLDTFIKARFVEMFEQGDYPQIEFGEICVFLRNGANIKQTKGAAGYPITRIETLANDVFNADRLGYADIFELGKYESYLLKQGDILISHINSVAYLGRAVQYRGQMASPIIHGMNLLCARIIEGYNPTYIEFFFNTPVAKEYISSITKKAVNQASITTSDLKKMKVPAPSLEKQNEFDRFVQQVDKSKFAVQKALDEARLLFDSLMQKYFG